MSIHVLAGTPGDLAHLKSKRIKNAKTVEQFLVSDGCAKAGDVYVVIGKAPVKTIKQLETLAQRTTAAVFVVTGQNVKALVRPSK